MSLVLEKKSIVFGLVGTIVFISFLFVQTNLFSGQPEHIECPATTSTSTSGVVQTSPSYVSLTSPSSTHTDVASIRTALTKLPHHFLECLADARSHMFPDASNGFVVMDSKMSKNLDWDFWWNAESRFDPLPLTHKQCNMIYIGAHVDAHDGVRIGMNEYQCKVYAFEPIPKFYEKLKTNMEQYTSKQHVTEGFGKQMELFNVGVSNSYKIVSLGAGQEAAQQGLSLIGKESIAISEENKNKECIRQEGTRENIVVCDAVDVFKSLKFDEDRSLDLLHMNCEGCEFDLLERLVETQIIKNIRILQVGTHVEGAELFKPKNLPSRYCLIREELLKTHNLIWAVPFAWERWVRKDIPLPEKK